MIISPQISKLPTEVAIMAHAKKQDFFGILSSILNVHTNLTFTPQSNHIGFNIDTKDFFPPKVFKGG